MPKSIINPKPELPLIVPFEARLAKLFLGTIIFLGAAAIGFVWLFPAVRFIASYEWTDGSTGASGIIILIVSGYAASRIVKHSNVNYEIEHRKWVDSGSAGLEPQPLECDTPRMMALLFGLPILATLCWFAIPAVWVPMATVAFSGETVTHRVVVDRRDKRRRFGREIEIRDHYALWGSIPWPSDDLWHSAKPGDELALRGYGNKFGVFYNSVEIVERNLKTDFQNWVGRILEDE